MKKVFILIIITIILVGCSLTNTPSAKVEKYLNNYINLSDDVIMSIDNSVSTEDLSNENKEIYKNILKREYENLKYEIKDESINGDRSLVTVKISVYDLYKAERDSLNYMSNNVQEFSDINGIFDNNLYNTYRLNQMLNANDIIDYEITFNLDKVDGEWILNNPDRIMLEKLNGLYNYDIN